MLPQIVAVADAIDGFPLQVVAQHDPPAGVGHVHVVLARRRSK